MIKIVDNLFQNLFNEFRMKTYSELIVRQKSVDLVTQVYLEEFPVMISEAPLRFLPARFSNCRLNYKFQKILNSLRKKNSIIYLY